MSTSSRAFCCLSSVKKQKHNFHVFLRLMYNEGIIRLRFYDIKVSVKVSASELLVIARGGGGMVPDKVLYGEAPPGGPTPYPFIYHSGRKGTPLIYLSLRKGTPFAYLL